MRSRLIATIAISTLTIAVSFTAPSPALAAQPQAPRNTGIVGTWIGTQKGFENGTYVNRQVRFIITKVKGEALTGTKSWRESNGQWSEPEGFQGVLTKSGVFRAVDEDGYILGELISPTRILGTYLEAGADQVALIQDIKKITR